MNPRLDDLLRQRDLIRAHLRWIEAEIEAVKPTGPRDREADRAETPAGASHFTSAAAMGSASLTAAAAPDPAAAAPPAVDSRNLHADVRRGCLLYFLAAFGALGAVVGYVFWRY